MSAHKVSSEIRAARKFRTKVLTAATTLTVKDMLTYDVIEGGNYAATLPAACAGLKGASCMFICNAASLTVVGIAADGTSTNTLGEGDMCIVYCNGTYWYSLNATIHA